MTRTRWALLVGGLAMLALAAWLWWTTPAVSTLLAPVVNRARQAVDVVSGVFEAARPVARAIVAAGGEEYAGCALAGFRNESGFDPFKYNVPVTDPVTGKTRYPSRTWDGQGEPPGDAFAIGIGQIVPATRRDWGLSARDAFDLETNVHACITRLWGPHWERVQATCADADFQLKAALMYVGHGEGGGVMDSALAAIRDSGVADWATACEGIKADWANKRNRNEYGFANAKPTGAHYWTVGGYAAWWQEKLPELLS